MNTIEQITNSLNNLSKIIYKCKITDNGTPLTGEQFIVLLNDLKILKDAIQELEGLQGTISSKDETLREATTHPR